MDKINVYLAGPITTVDTLEEANEYRQKTSEEFALRGIQTINPLRHKKEELKFSYRPNEIVDRDTMDIRRADAIICDYTDKNHQYIGTSMEIMYAYTHEKPIFVITDWADKHYWIQYHATQIFSTIEEAAEYLVEFFDK